MISRADYLTMLSRLERSCERQPQVKASSSAADHEHDLQSAICDWLRGHGWFFVWSPMRAATSTPIGTPDFIIAAPQGRTLWIEAKSRTGKQTVEQRGAQMMLERQGHVYAVVRSMEEFLPVVQATLYVQRKS